MVSNDGSMGPTDPAAGTRKATRPRRARTAAEQREELAARSKDPEVLAAEIERTREELAETLDAIADKVSPKRVAGRTKKKVGDAVKEGTDTAAASVKTGAAHLKDAAHDVKQSVQHKVDAAKDDVESIGRADTVEMSEPDDRPATVDPLGARLPPLEGGHGMHPVPPVTDLDAYPSSPRLSPAAIAGAAAALLVVVLVVRRRRR